MSEQTRMIAALALTIPRFPHFNRNTIIGRCEVEPQHLAPIAESRSEGEQVPEENKRSAVHEHFSAGAVPS
jgi:hypothetical protein